LDEDEFAAVYAKTYRSLLGYALRRCHSPDDAADVVAETFTIAWRRAADLPAGDEARLWLYGVARRVLANHLRTGDSAKRARHPRGGGPVLVRGVSRRWPVPARP
jgi:DNA-directed RNA polymerase specialized sigma24 family protein